MSSLSFPDVNVWLAVLIGRHVHRSVAQSWWNQDQSDVIGFTRVTQLSVLRLLTKSAAMNGSPLTLRGAWSALDKLFEDERVALVREPVGVEARLRRLTSDRTAMPRLWADAYLVAFADESKGAVVTFDRALAARSRNAVLLA